ncbi:unnamed protein product [Bursaphelenchus xylophilus]|uniref:(pine wood nematode) hypothetical protein n=1 Tax=Bursaphelenchus xylophilus TaxID=6326 RepID=A0A1I7SQF4_BURXY|nr:unnamed protein product [Bursaphelenchus xylophilus]CAG9109819.1 unnamed protein product [Bursaphelenchus xylophilus]
MARVIVLRNDDDDYIPENYIVKKNGKTYRPISRRQILHQDDEEDLDFRSIRPFSKLTHRKHTVPEFSHRLEDQFCHHDDTIVLKCNFTGYPMPEVVWFKGQTPIFNEMRRTVHTSDNSTELCIFNANKEDGGFYSCRIENDMGVRETSCHVHIGDTGKLPGKLAKLEAAINYRTYRNALYTPSYTYSRFPGTWR